MGKRWVTKWPTDEAGKLGKTGDLYSGPWLNWIHIRDSAEVRGVVLHIY